MRSQRRWPIDWKRLLSVACKGDDGFDATAVEEDVLPLPGPVHQFRSSLVERNQQECLFISLLIAMIL